jgi:hypothetical protein
MPPALYYHLKIKNKLSALTTDIEKSLNLSKTKNTGSESGFVILYGSLERKEKK